MWAPGCCLREAEVGLLPARIAPASNYRLELLAKLNREVDYLAPEGPSIIAQDEAKRNPGKGRQKNQSPGGAFESLCWLLGNFARDSTGSVLTQFLLSCSDCPVHGIPLPAQQQRCRNHNQRQREPH